MREELLRRGAPLRAPARVPTVVQPRRSAATGALLIRADSRTNLLDLQRLAGNRAVNEVLHRKADEEESAETETEAENPSVEGLSGTITEFESSEEEEEGVVKGPLDTNGNFRAEGRPAAPRRRPLPANGTTVLSMQAAGAVNVSSEQTDPSGLVSKEDSLSATTTTTWSNPGGKRTSAFGSESFKPKFQKAKWTAEGGVVKVDLKIDVKCPWGVKSSNIDIASGTSSKIKADNYQAIVDDLTPVLEGKSWRAPRGKYWSKALCARHEQFHSTDDKAWVEGPGKQLVTNYLNAQTITLTADDKKSATKTKSAINRQVKEAVADAKTEFRIANGDYYTGGENDYVDYAGEERANLDGKPHYEALAAEVLKQGQKLEKEKQDKEDAKEARKKLKEEQREAAQLAKQQSAEEKAKAKEARLVSLPK